MLIIIKKTAIEKDKDWLNLRKSSLDVDKFSDWVTRMFDAGFQIEIASEFDYKNMNGELKNAK